MISVVRELGDIVRDEFISSDDSGTKITLKEKKVPEYKPFPLNKGNSTTLTLEIDIDGFDGHPILKAGVENLKKYPDYLIFCENKNFPEKIFVFIVELKSDNPGDWHRQAKAGLSVAQYLVGMLENFR